MGKAHFRLANVNDLAFVSSGGGEYQPLDQYSLFLFILLSCILTWRIIPKCKCNYAIML